MSHWIPACAGMTVEVESSFHRIMLCP
ncbi:protein of unknown function [Cupriavidus taiwanensis]|nr:protein of unknown function [Cupriavidus taiwanensis]